MYAFDRLQPSRSGRSWSVRSFHAIAGLYVFHAAATAASASLASASGTSTSAIQESPSGAATIVMSPAVDNVHSAGATNGLPRVVAVGVSAVSAFAAVSAAEAGMDEARARARRVARVRIRRGYRSGRA